MPYKCDYASCDKRGKNIEPNKATYCPHCKPRHAKHKGCCTLHILVYHGGVGEPQPLADPPTPKRDGKK